MLGKMGSVWVGIAALVLWQCGGQAVSAGSTGSAGANGAGSASGGSASADDCIGEAGAGGSVPICFHIR